MENLHRENCHTTPTSNIAAAISIASKFFASTRQKNTRANFTAAAVTAKAIKLPATIGDNADFDDNGTAVAVITQHQTNEIDHIQVNLGNYASSIDGCLWK